MRHDRITAEETIIAILGENGGTMAYGKLRREIKKWNPDHGLSIADGAILKLWRDKRVRLLNGQVTLLIETGET